VQSITAVQTLVIFSGVAAVTQWSTERMLKSFADIIQCMFIRIRI